MTNLAVGLGLDKLDNKKIILIIITCLVIVYVDFNFLMASQSKMLKNLSPKIIQVKADLANLDKELAVMQDLKNKQAALAPAAGLKMKKVISEEDIPSLLKTISDVANINDVRITQMKPAKEPQAGGGPKTSSGAGGDSLAAVLITLDLAGGYHNLGRFINDLENVEIFIAVDNLKIMPQSSADYLKQRANLVLKTYVKK